VSRLRCIEHLLLSLLFLTLLQCARSDSSSPMGAASALVTLPAVHISKSNSLPIYAHYMPWFADKTSSDNGRWGLHWTMATSDPDHISADGRRQIAAHYYPLIGPYASSDRDLIDYHLLLMKFSGIDGLLIDWPSAHDALDYGLNRRNAEALVERIDAVGLGFAIVYEDYTTAEVAKVQPTHKPIDIACADLRYIAANYFAHERYIYIEGAPLLLVFGPRLFNMASEWAQIISDDIPQAKILSL
jgi:hypothetical protein